MRRSLPALTGMILLATTPLAARGQEKNIQYNVALEGLQTSVPNSLEKKGRHVTVWFKVKRAGTEVLDNDVPEDDFVVYEDGKRVRNQKIYRPNTGPLTTILAMDISGSMKTDNRIEQARRAGLVFLDRLNPKADCGLILFDHEMRIKEAPARDSHRLADHRNRIRQHISEAQPLGGTAWLDAAAESVQLLQGIPGRKAILVMTDGVDLNSRHKLAEVIEMARAAEVPVYTLGVGEPGKNEPVTTVLTLDHSGSMLGRADTKDKLRKIEALHQAGTRFVDLIRPGARMTLLPFSDKPEQAAPFSEDKAGLKAKIQGLQAKGETALFDATFDALMTLKADTDATVAEGKPVGKRAIVSMTDGIDNKSRRRVGEVIKLANETRTPLYMLGLGRSNEIDQKVMRRMAEETGGKYYHAENQQKLVEIFENLSILLHDDGIDEKSLKQLATETGGKYFLARDVSKLPELFSEVAEELQNTYRATYQSERSNDGTVSGVAITIERGGVLMSNIAQDSYARHGVVLAQLHPGVYLVLLALLGGLLVLPGSLRRMVKTVGGH